MEVAVFAGLVVVSGLIIWATRWGPLSGVGRSGRPSLLAAFGRLLLGSMGWNRPPKSVDDTEDTPPSQPRSPR